MMAYELHEDLTPEELEHIFRDMMYDYVTFGTCSCFIKPLKEKYE